MLKYFMDIIPNIEGNNKLREPQIEAYLNIRDYFEGKQEGEALVVLPTGTGKSGLISLAPYGISKKRVLIITPGIITKKSVVETLHPLDENFWTNYDVIFDPKNLPVVEEYDSDMLQSSIEKSNFIITNIHQLYKSNPNSLINRVDADFFDFIIVDEAHHSIADTWQEVIKYFKNAKILHVTGTPYRGDGQEIPGELIHETKLSEVMALRYVKLLRKATVDNTDMYFTIPGNDKRYSKDEVLQLKDKEWIERSVALSKECSLDVIDNSIKRLNELKELSPNVNHKILAVGCSIDHAEDIAKWYEDRGKRVSLVHSRMKKEDVESKLLDIELHRCDVVVSVNMLMEGYDHKYLTVLAIFRPYRSKNSFAQIVGRILRAIPEEEITDHNIDNNAFVIYHKETGLDNMWEEFQSEVNKSKEINIIEKDYTFSNKEYKKREIIYGGVTVEEAFLTEEESYMEGLDFNKLFEEARNKIEDDINKKLEDMNIDIKSISEEDLNELKSLFREKEYSKKSSEIDSIILEKRPELARNQLRKRLMRDANEAADYLLEIKNIDPKSNSLYQKFKRHIYKLNPETTNAGIVVRYINTKVNRKYGSVKTRENDELIASQKYMIAVVEELERMI